MSFREYLNEAWSTHATDPKKVAEEFKQHFNLMESDDDVMAMARIIVHVCGEHLGEWIKGIELLKKLKNNAPIKDTGEMNRYMAILNLGNNPNSSIDNFSLSDQARIYASTASALANLGGLKNAEKFLKLASQIAEMNLSKDDPANKAIAMTGNNVACSLEEKNERSDVEVGLMILAANLGRKYWEIAGTWKEVERAEYRLALTCLQAGLPEESLTHAQACLEINSQNNNEPLEVFFGFEALAMAQKALKNQTAFERARQQMQDAFDKLPSNDQDWYKAILEKL
ncbi:MAG: hypothetical protein WC635_13370 [Bacteriovorax sp.]|jgi:tetratricopeptide (TPR) repeat protein